MLLIVGGTSGLFRRLSTAMKKPEPQAKLGSAIRRARQEVGLSQEQLAFNCGLHRTYIGSVERGERNLSLENIVRVAEALGRRASTLLAQADL